jgi:hypothetical protein
MKPDTPEFEHLVTRMRDMISDLSDAGLKETAALVRMAHIDLISRVHGISQEELDTLLFVARSGQQMHEQIAAGETVEHKRAAGGHR